MPRHIEPMMAALSVLPQHDEQYAFEFKWDGVRALAYWDGRQLQLESRNLLNITPRYPELSALGDALGPDRRVVLDGEIVALDDAGAPSFAKLQHRMHVQDARQVQKLMATIPVYYFIFDVLYLDGQSTMDLPYRQRRAMLEEVALVGNNWRLSVAEYGDGEAMLATAREHHLEGLVAKQLESLYEPGRRSGAWRKIKIVQRQEFVVGGWIPEKSSSQQSRVGALLLGYHDCNKLHYAGNVGSGFSNATHHDLVARLRPLKSRQSPFAESVPKRSQVIFVKPQLVVDVDFRRWPDGAMVQQASFKGLREDKDAQDVVKERIQ